MRKRLFQLPARVGSGTRIAIAVTGFVLVHIAAYFLFTASAPYMGSFLGILGLMLFVLGSSKPARKPLQKNGKKPVGKPYYYLKA